MNARNDRSPETSGNLIARRRLLWGAPLAAGAMAAGSQPAAAQTSAPRRNILDHVSLSSPTLAADIESALTQYEGDWLFPAGRYELHDTVQVRIQNGPMSIECSPGAVFDLRVDGDGFKFLADAGVKLSQANPGDVESVDFSWRGGLFLQTDQPVSKVVPWVTGAFPAANPGQANTASCLDFRPRTIGGDPAGRFGHLDVSDCTFLGHEVERHWQNAGGDTGIFINNCESARITGCEFVGMRDLGIYIANRDGECGAVTIIGNAFESCAGGAAFKSGSNHGVVTGNVFNNCGRGVIAQTASEPSKPGGENLAITGNTFVQCWRAVLLEYAESVVINGNSVYRSGNLLADGSVPTESQVFRTPAIAFEVGGSRGVTIVGNTVSKILHAWHLAGKQAWALWVREHERPGSQFAANEGLLFAHNSLVSLAQIGEEQDPATATLSVPTKNTQVHSNLINGNVGGFTVRHSTSAFTSL